MSQAVDLSGFEERPPRMRWFGFAAPDSFYALAGRLLPWCWGAAALFGMAGLVVGLAVAPSDAEQGDAYRIAFIHIPAVWMSMAIYVVMAASAGAGLVLPTRLPAMMATALAPTGALLAFLGLWTGSLWGKPAFGTWWVWDARLTCELILLLLFIGFMAMQASIDDQRRGDRAGAMLALLGMPNVPVVYLSVDWWNTRHPGSSLDLPGVPGAGNAMLAGMLLMAAALLAWSIAAALHRVRSIILERELGTAWAAQLPEARQ